MKFTDGQWQNRVGYQVNKLTQVVDCDFTGEKLTLHVSTKPILNRGNTTDSLLIQVDFSAPIKNIIQIDMKHYAGVRTKYPSFDLSEDKCLPEFTKYDDKYVFTSGKTQVHIQVYPYKLDFYHDGSFMTSSSIGSAAYIITPDNKKYMRDQMSLGVGENVYGLGERFTSYIKNGQVIDIWNEDGGTSSEISYKNIPYYMTDKGYGVLVNETGKISYEVASENVEKVQFSIEKESLSYMVIGGSNMKETLGSYTDLSGKPPVPPAWSFGLWLSTSFTTDYDDKTVNSFIDGMTERDIPLNVFHFDCFWMREYQWSDFKWDDKVFADPKGLLASLKAKGLKICVWINPYIAQKSEMFAEGMENNYLLNRPNGDVYQVDKWQPGMAIVDFTNKDACKWYQGKLKKLLDMGVDCFKTDFGERIPTDIVYSDGSDSVAMHNYYTYLYNKTVYNLLQVERGEDDAVVFARSATVTGQQFPVHWGGDCWGTYESMAESLRGGLSLCMTGFGYWSHDIGGFEQSSPADVYKRWVQFGLLSSHSRLHGSSSYRVPWVYDDEAVDVLRAFTKLKCTLMPYLYSQAKQTATRGLPMMRSMVLEFPSDPACKPLDLQYMLGERLLVAPVFDKSGDVTYYLPKGRWTNLLTNQVKDGGAFLSENHNYMTLPLMVPENTILPIGREEYQTDYDFTDRLDLHVFELVDGESCSITVESTDGKSLTALAALSDNEINIHIVGEINDVRILLHNVDSIKNLDAFHSYDCTDGIYLDAANDMKIIL